MSNEDKNNQVDESKIEHPQLQNHVGKVIVPVSEQAKKELDEHVIKPDQSEKSKLTEPTKEAPLSTDLNFDNLNKVSSATNDMQQPRIYDTKQYYVPINDTKHKHGFIAGTIIAGLVTAILVVGVLVMVSMSA